MYQIDMTSAESKFRCPICRDELRAGFLKGHFRQHWEAGEVPPELEQLVKTIEKRGKRLKKKHYDHLSGKKPRKQGKNAKQGSAELPEYEKMYRSEDLWERRRPLSGGGGPGTGKKR
tara:strand:+ start:1608 stop:1958 length:351 start_codon:yes stop_codon:yes gene_type:complete